MFLNVIYNKSRRHNIKYTNTPRIRIYKKRKIPVTLIFQKKISLIPEIKKNTLSVESSSSFKNINMFLMKGLRNIVYSFY